MPEFIHSFNRGRMNKDLDERLVPNGEYRDALNLDIANSENGNVGALQNIKGNLELKGNSDGIGNWDTKYIDGYTDAHCVGSINDELNEKIYWFIASDSVSAIAEYDQTTNTVSPILVDKQNILNFTKNKYITGINIIDKFLFWTDNETEPKKINIQKFKTGSIDFDTHTKIPDWAPSNNTYQFNAAGTDFAEEHITVIKKSPLTAPSLDMSVSKFGDDINGTGITPAKFTGITYPLTVVDDFVFVPDTSYPEEYQSLPTYSEWLYNITEDADYYDNSNLPSDWDGTIKIQISELAPAWKVGDTIILSSTTTSLYGEDLGYKINAIIENITYTTITIKILSISNNIAKQGDDLISWDILLKEAEPMFIYKFPRYAYRWKYIDNEYSSYSPFSEVAFLGSKFEYVSSDGYNIGMTNNIRKLIITELDWGDSEVAEIDILYKESNNNIVYKVETLKRKDYSPYFGGDTLPTTYQIQSEIIGNVIQANQILRPWDNVPQKALSQDTSGNRLIYGNYLQNYSVPTISLDANNNPEYILDSDEASTIELPVSSLKSIRTYQVGVVFKDKYGRETPIITTSNAALNIPVSDAALANKLSITPTVLDELPEWITHYKFFVKDISNEYYNLALDRYYEAEDGNVWLSFPSSERNKVDESTYLVLKKQHNNSTPVDELSKYKILAIESSAPDFIATTEKQIAFSDVTITSALDVSYTSIKFTGPSISQNSAFSSGISTGNYISITAAGQSTRLYEISGGGIKTAGGTDYDITLTEPLDNDASFLAELGNSFGATIYIIKKEIERKPEFEGRFFVKINRDFSFEENIIKPFNESIEKKYNIKEVTDLKGVSNNNKLRNSSSLFGLYYRDKADDLSRAHERRVYGYDSAWGGIGSDLSNKKMKGYNPPTQGEKSFGISRCGYATGSSHPIFGTSSRAGAKIGTGSFIRFVDNSTGSPQTSDIVYEVKRIEYVTSYRYKGSSSAAKASRNRTSYILFLDKEISDSFLPSKAGDFTSLNSSQPTFQILEEYQAENNRLLTSNNPAIFETEPKESIDLDLYYEASDAIEISNFENTNQTLDYFNCYSYGNGVESNRIRDDFNAVTIDKGAKVSSILDEPYMPERRASGLIFSQIYNTTSGVNGLNQFIQAEAITKDLNPAYGSIQKLHARQTDLLALCENKIVKILSNKDALFNADGNVNLTGNTSVLGQAMVPATFGEFGIGKNPESFAIDNYRVYFTDKNKGAVLRLSMDGITNIAEKGMSDFIADNLKASNKLVGSYDDDKGTYNLTLDNLSQEWKNKLSTNRDYQFNSNCGEVTAYPENNTTISFKEEVDGWTSRKSFIPESGLSLNSIYYTFKNGLLWQHNINETYNNFYGEQYLSSVNLFINDQPQIVKGFSTINYTGTQSRRLEYLYNSNWYSISEINFNTTIPTNKREKLPGWFVDYIKTDLEGGEIKEFEKKEGKWFNYIKGLEVFKSCNPDSSGIGIPVAVESETQDYEVEVTIDTGTDIGSGSSTGSSTIPDKKIRLFSKWTEFLNFIPYITDIRESATDQDVVCSIEQHYNNVLANSSDRALNFEYALMYATDQLEVGTQLFRFNNPSQYVYSFKYVYVPDSLQQLNSMFDPNDPAEIPDSVLIITVGASGTISDVSQYNTITCP